jgi:hypothetical protein
MSPECVTRPGEAPGPNPYVFIVGCPRSGTTLLQRLVDGHASLAVTPETHWIPRWFEKRGAKGVTPEGLATRKLMRKLLANPRFLEMGIGGDELERLFGGGKRVPYPCFVSGLFDLYGQKRGKPLVGDKTPGYARSLGTLHALWPRARFVHLIRDGRDVCLSLLSWERARGWKADEGAARFGVWAEDRACAAALWWEWHVRLAREAGGTLGPALYYELRYESLITRPAEECARLCAFLALPYEGTMLERYESRVRTEAGEDGKHPWRPITPGLRDWRSHMAAEDIELFEAAAGGLLEDLGYPRAAPGAGPEAGRYAGEARARWAREARLRRYAVPGGW